MTDHDRLKFNLLWHVKLTARYFQMDSGLLNYKKNKKLQWPGARKLSNVLTIFSTFTTVGQFFNGHHRSENQKQGTT